MKTDTTKDVWVDVSGLPHKPNVGVLWGESIGMKVPFKYYDIVGEFDLLDYKKKEHLLTIKYKNKKPKEIKTDGFIGCNFVKYIEYHQVNWKYNIGECLIDKNRDIIIINRKEVCNNGKYVKLYQYKCNKCGFDCSEHYRDQVYQEELWVAENKLQQRVGCACCHSKITVPGINDIPTTAPWMIPFFQGGEKEAKMYTRTSSRKIYPKCLDCGTISKTKHVISDLYSNGGFLCVCNDSYSYPSKFSYSLFMQLSVPVWYPEYSPEWAGLYRYDIYFELNNRKYLVELDGLLGHGEQTYKSAKTDTEGLKRDKIKNKLAKDNGIQLIRIDCKKSDMHYIKNNILKSELNNLFDLSTVNWIECDKFATKNLVKELCEYWKNHNYPIYDEVAKIYHLPPISVRKYLRKGGSFGWCDYENHKRDKNKKKIKVYNQDDKLVGVFLGMEQFCRDSISICGVHFDVTNITKAIKNNKRYNNFKFEWVN